MMHTTYNHPKGKSCKDKTPSAQLNHKDITHHLLQDP